MRKKNSKKGQVWTIDFIIGMTLFILTLILGIKIILDIYAPGDFTKTYREAIHLSDTIVSSGYPLNWNSTNVIIPGVADYNRINITKLQEFENLDYYTSKSLLHLTSDFIFFIKNSTNIINVSSCIYGYNLTTDSNCTPNLPVGYDNLVKIDRNVIYNSNVYTLTFYVWD